jgi:hypothetical protein
MLPLKYIPLSKIWLVSRRCFETPYETSIEIGLPWFLSFLKFPTDYST